MSDQQPHRQAGPAAAASAGPGTLPRRFEALAAAQPRAPLVVYGEWRLSYRDVNSAANRLAHRLVALGVARNVPVGLCLDRGPDLLVAILAVLKAGGAYVPLDPHWPANRLRRMRAAVDPRVLISRTVFLPQFADHAGPVVDLDRDQSVIAAASDANPDVPIDPARWCYVLFTSGSTGAPKGVPVTHGNLLGLFPPLTAALDFGPGDVWTWFHSASFGFSVWELWGALLHGGSVVIVPENIRQDPAALGELVAEEQVTVFSQTPSAFRRVLHDARFHASIAGSRLRYLALSGEAIRRDDIAGWLARGHRARLINTYAITETAGQVALRVYGEGDATEEGARNLGQPLAGREVLVLDAAGRPAPAGAAGELWVGGACVTPGYLAAPEQASRFSEIAVPGGGIVRGYRSGDRVRQLADGSLEYLGRVDAQLKFRGYRIEPGDIEAALREHPGVRDAAVGLRADAAGNQRLTAWVVAGESAVPALSRSGTLEFWPSLGAYGIYDEWLYGLMNTEPVRLAAYRAAFAAAVPGKVVLDIGTGEDAVLARLCVEAGAAHVYAVEVLEGAARAATELVRRLGMQDRITVLHGDIADLDLPQAVDVCTQGIIGNIGSADGIGTIWNTARRHFAAGCVPVPERCVTRIAALELPAAVRAGPGFGPLAADYARRLFASVGQPFDLRLCVRNVASDDLLTAAAEFEVLDFSGELATTHTGGAELRVTRDGLLDGCLLWTVVTAGAGQTVDYFREQRAWLPVYLPLGDEPLAVRRGDCLQLRWESRLQSDARFPDYSVTATLASVAGPIERTAVTRHRSSIAGGTRLHRALLAQLAAGPPGASAPTVTGLRRWLDTRVPEHLVPQSWVFLAELPLGPGDKLDREALPAPGTDRPQLAEPPVAPRSAAEQAVADLWTEVTGLEALGVEDDFFDLGGDSITAVQLITRLQRWLDAGVPLAALFDTPTIAGLARYLQGNFPDALAAALSRADRPVAADAAAPDLAPDPRPAPESPLASQRTPLTFSQQSLWFLHELYPGDTSASEQFAIRLRGPLDRAALVRAWEGVVRRHPILAATFQAGGETGTEMATEMGTCLISVPEMRHVPISVAISGDDGLLAAAESELREAFNLRDGPPVRALLCELGPESHVLVVTAHHIVADGMSVPVLQADLAQWYVAEAAGGAATVAAGSPAGLSCADLAIQPEWQQGMSDPEALAWWQQRLADLPPPALQELVRPPRAPENAPRLSRRVPFTIDASVADGLRRLARATGATPYMVVLAAFRALLVRLTAQPDICIGTPMTLRDTPELRRVVGCLVNPVVLRAPLDVRQSFRAHLLTERDAALDAFRYRNVPFARVVEAVAPARELGAHPLFQILFSWEPAATAITVADGVTFDPVSLAAARSSYFDLECALRDAGEGAGLSGHFAWSTSVLEDWVAEQLPRSFCTLLGEVLARPDAPIERLSVLTAAESRRLLVDWNATGAALPATRTLHESFLVAAERCPDATAIRHEQGSWSYAALAARSAALAAVISAELAARGFGAGSRVGVALGRSPELVLGVLAVLRAGGMVVPLDPRFPRARLQFMARDADLALVLVQSTTLPDGVGETLLATGATVIDLDHFRPDALVDDRIPLAAIAGDAPAMMLYTSGSTGQPKGAITTHRSAVNRCHWMWASFGFRDDEVFSLRTSLNFIDAWWEIFGALSHGATLSIVPDDVATDPLRLPGFLADRGVTQLVLVPSLLRALLEQLSADEQALPALRWCITSGEPLTPDLVAECARLLPGTVLLNTYGTSEIWDATAFDTRLLAGGAPRVPIGRPVANARVYVVDPAGQPLPPGFPGELQVAGFGVGPGYWRRPELTAEKFHRLELPGVSEALVYRTGDRARFLADGQVECLGRLDAQFKLRGQRIEPAEIEQAIAAHPAVAAAVVGLAGEGSAAVLVAGVVRSAGSTLPAAKLIVELRERLGALLPAWMVPTEWCELPALPHTPTGKLDRRAWLVSGIGAAVRAPAMNVNRAPRGDVERQLLGLWSAVLGRDSIGVDDNFFDLGGHSLLAARLLNRIRTTFGVSLELRALFVAPTVAGLALAIRAVRGGQGAEPRTPLLPGPEAATPAPLSFGQERLWFLDQLDPGSPAYNVAWTIRCTGRLDLPALRTALDAVVARHPALRTRFPAAGGRPSAVIDPVRPVALVVRDLTGSTGSADDLAAELSRVAREPFVLDREPLFRATLLKTGEHEHYLVLVAQHIVTDATSNHLLFADLVTALSCATKGRAPQWPALPLTYA
ncbi:MAG: amino acid adenylation domain-containing protein, partial [Gammaproteobacteria bacterium]|nr:amino acid adenylation domain-containing protein [Gammaproteobacteria bacterium]